MGIQNISFVYKITYISEVVCIFLVIFLCTLLPFRFAHITTKATAHTVPAGSPLPAPSFTSASTMCRVTVSLALRVRGPIMSMHRD